MIKRHFLAHYQSLVALAIRALSVLAGFVVTYFIGHRLGPAANGQYALVTQTAMFLSIVSVGGIDMAVVREFSATVARKITLHRFSFIRVTLQSMGFAAAIIVILAVAGQPLLNLLGRAAVPEDAIPVLSIILVSRTLTRLMSAVLRSQRSYILGQAVEVLLIPACIIVPLAIGLLHDVSQVLWATAWAGMAVSLVGIGGSLRFTTQSPDALSVPMRKVLRVAVPLWGVAIALNISDWYSLAVVSAVLGVYQAGLYRVALQIGTAMAIISMGLFSVYSAQISAAHHADDRAAVARLARSATIISTLCALPMAAILFVLARRLLFFIGPEFASAAIVVRIMIVGQTLYTITGPSGLVLALTGHERVNFLITAISTASLAIVAPFAAKMYGLVGVVSYVAAILVGRNVASLYGVWRLERINVMTGAVRDAAPQPSVTGPSVGKEPA